MKARYSVVSIVLYLSVFIMLASCRTEKTEWKGTIEEEDGVTVVNNPKEPMYGEDVINYELELSLGGKGAIFIKNLNHSAQNFSTLKNLQCYSKVKIDGRY